MTTRKFMPDKVQPTDAELQQPAEADRLTSEHGRSQIPKLLGVMEVAQVLGLPKASVYRIITTRLLKSIRIGRRLKVSQEDLLTFIRNGGAGLN